MKKEIWKDIPGYEGYYQASNMGSIRRVEGYVKHPARSLKIQRTRVLKQATTTNGYKNIMLSISNQKKQFLVHRLVAFAWIPTVKNKPHINHINGIKTDNRVENLEWCSVSENEKHKYRVLGKTKAFHNLPGISIDIENAITIGQKTHYGVKSIELIKSFLSGSIIRVSEFESSKAGSVLLSKLKNSGVPIQNRRVYYKSRNYYKEYYISKENIQLIKNSVTL